MRIWTLHPIYLDSRGLVALWREALLAQRVLQGLTRGYRSHPQLIRFQAQPDPLAAVAAYLDAVAAEALRRGYRFDVARIVPSGPAPLVRETQGQMLYEWKHLSEKLRLRDPVRWAAHRGVDAPSPHPLFEIVPGPIATWERLASPG
jgi:hypothetical protein